MYTCSFKKLLPSFKEIHILNKSGVVAHPVMQVYGSLALEDNSEVDETGLARCSISCAF